MNGWVNFSFLIRKDLKMVMRKKLPQKSKTKLNLIGPLLCTYFILKYNGLQDKFIRSWVSSITSFPHHRSCRLKSRKDSKKIVYLSNSSSPARNCRALRFGRTGRSFRLDSVCAESRNWSEIRSETFRSDWSLGNFEFRRVGDRR